MDRREFIKGLSVFSAVALSAPTSSAAAKGFSSADNRRWFEFTRPLMGTFVSIAVYEHFRARAEELIFACFEFIERRIEKISDWEETSDTTRLRNNLVLRRSDCSAAFLEVIAASNRIKRLSGNMFEPLCFGLSKLWREASAAGTVPHRAEIKAALEGIKTTHVTVTPLEVRLHGAAGFDFGGSGKGYIADIGCGFLKAHGARYARIDCGGDMRLLGKTGWSVDVEDPRAETMLGTLFVNHGCGVASSGDYRNCWFVNGKRFHHLVSPRTGYPGSKCQQVTVIAPDAVTADGLATAVFFMDPAEGLRFLNSLPGTEGIIVDQKHQLHLTRGVPFISYAT